MYEDLSVNNKEQHIINLLHAGDKKAIEIIYDQYAPALYGVVLKIVQSEEIAQDVMQDAFVKVWQNASHYNKAKGSLFTWLLNIARNKAIDATRSKHFKNGQKIQSLDHIVHTNRKLSEETQIQHIGLKRLVGNLDSKYRIVIDLIYFKGYTQKEVGEYLDIPLGTVKSRVKIALRELRKVFNHTKVGLITFLLSLFS